MPQPLVPWLRSCKAIDQAHPPHFSESNSPIRDLQTLLDGSTTYVSQGRLQGLNVDELTSRLIAANAITRIAATLLWALLAFVLHRSEELLRMDTALTCFMQAWQTSSATSSAVAMHDTVSVSVRPEFSKGRLI